MSAASKTPYASPSPRTVSCSVATRHGRGGRDHDGRKRRCADAALPSLSGTVFPDAVHDHDHLRGLCAVPSIRVAHGGISVGLRRSSAADLGRFSAERRCYDPLHNGGLGDLADRRPRGPRIRNRAGAHDLGGDLPGILRCPMDHRRYHPRGWRLEALKLAHRERGE
jgi:hypothetical protein